MVVLLCIVRCIRLFPVGIPVKMARFSTQGRMMDIEEFEKKVQPRAKRSRLEPFQAQIFELKAKGYANWQVCEWLAANDLKVSQEAVRKFIKSREGKTERVHAPLSGTQAVQGQRVYATNLTAGQTKGQAATPQSSTPKEGPEPAEAAPGEARKITNPADIRKARKREINLDDYTDKEGE